MTLKVLQAQGANGAKLRYTGMVDVLRKTVQADGFKGLYRVSMILLCLCTQSLPLAFTSHEKLWKASMLQRRILSRGVYHVSRLPKWKNPQVSLQCAEVQELLVTAFAIFPSLLPVEPNGAAKFFATVWSRQTA